MTDDSIEAKALALINEERAKTNNIPLSWVQVHYGATAKALCRAIEQHEAFKQEVSDAVEEYKADQPYVWKQSASDYFCRFIIPKPKPDPLVEALDALKDGRAGPTTESYAACLRAALEVRGLEIREKGE